jgi:hypothetical protein
VFIKPSSGWVTTYTPNAVLTGSNESANDSFGQSVAIVGNGDMVVAGSPFHGVGGAAYLFVKPASGWTNKTQTAELIPPDSGGFFGQAVNIPYGSIVAVGAPDNGTGSKGAVYLYSRPASGWKNTNHAVKLIAKGKGIYEFGSSFSMSGKAAIVGAGSGAAYVFMQRVQRP